MKPKKDNLLITFLSHLQIPYTQTFSRKFFEEHPHKFNLYGISHMLHSYNIPNKGIQLNEKEKNLIKIPTPFIAPFAKEFVVVYENTEQFLRFVWKGQDIKTTPEEFNKNWSGVVLLAEKNEDSLEPGYKDNRKAELMDQIQKILLGIAFVVLGSFLVVKREIYKDISIWILLLLNLTGIGFGTGLVMKQLKISSEYVDKICSLLKQSDCNNILESKAAKFMGVFGWSEIGLSYFTGNIVMILIAPQLLPYIAILNVLSLPYSFWSIWYQKFRAKQWCPLCLGVMGLLWLLFITNLFYGYIHLPDNSIQPFILTGLGYFIPFTIINLTIPSIKRGMKEAKTNYEINHIKAQDEVFLAILKKEIYYPVDLSVSKILFGDPDVKLRISILTNPHCNPCGKMHKRVEKLLEETRNRICVQYIFSYFTEDLLPSNKGLIDIYMSYPPEEMKKIYAEWFESGKDNPEAFFDKYPGHTGKETVEMESSSHTQWREEHHLKTTPTILINGYKIPNNYKIEDLAFFVNLDVSHG